MQLFLVFLAFFQIGHALSLDESCSAEDAHICGTCKNVQCEVSKDNFIGSITSVTSSEKCQEWCTKRNDYMNDCQYITYFGNKGLPIQNICYMYSSCVEKSGCTNCTTEKFDCLCSSSTVSKIDTPNLLDNVILIPSEDECRKKCRDHTGCEFYTYLTGSLECFLLSHLIEPISLCKGCKTGKADCNTSPTTPTTPEITSTTTTPTTSTIQGCPVDWIFLNDKCYLMSPTIMNWYQAQQFCAEKGGWLAEIFSLEEQSSINDILLDNIYYWIGLTDSAEEGHFVWQHSNQSLSWSNWGKGEPAHGYSDEDCAVMVNDISIWPSWQWHSINCNYDHGNNFPCQGKTSGNSQCFNHALCEFGQ